MGDINAFFENLMIRIRARCEEAGNRLVVSCGQELRLGVMGA